MSLLFCGKTGGEKMTEKTTEYKRVWKDIPQTLKNRTTGSGVRFGGKYVRVKETAINRPS